MQRVLITRAEPEASRLAEVIASCGHRAVLAPLAQLQSCAVQWPDILPEALIFTSSNAPTRTTCANVHGLPVFAIGARTAAAAQSAGFSNIEAVADGHYAKLLQSLMAAPYRQYWHIGGHDLRHDIGADLALQQKSCAAIAVYEMTSVTALPAEAQSALQARALDRVLIFSPRSAQRAIALLGDAGSWLPAFVLSEAIAAPLRAAGWNQVHVSITPDMRSLLASAGLMCEEADVLLKGTTDDR
jgi:uroporphyrinogen-III synthase